MIGRRLVLLASAAALVSGPAGAQSRARVTFANERVYTGVLSVDESGELILDCDRLGGPAAVDFPKVRRLELLEDEPAPDLTSNDVMTVVGAERYLGELTGVIGESITFRSARLGDITVPRELVGDVRPRGAAAAAPVAPAAAVPRSGQWEDWAELEGGARVEDAALLLPARDAVASRAADLAGNHISIDLRWKGLAEFRVDVGGVTLQTWDGVPVLFGRGDDGLELAMAPSALPNDSGALLRLRLDGADALDARTAAQEGPITGVHRGAAGLDRDLGEEEIRLARVVEQRLHLIGAEGDRLLREGRLHDDELLTHLDDLARERLPVGEEHVVGEARA